MFPHINIVGVYIYISLLFICLHRSTFIVILQRIHAFKPPPINFIMIKSTKGLLGIIFLAVALVTQPVRASETHKNWGKETQSSGLFDWRARFFMGTKYNMANLDESKTMPIYSENRNVTIKAGDGWGSTVVTPGVEGVFNISKSLDLTLGVDLELDFAEKATGDKQRGMYNYYSARNINESNEKEILAFDQLTPEIFSLYPFAGINFKIPHAKIGIDYSIPLKRFNRGWGYRDQNGVDITSSESYRARGSRLSLRVSSREYERFTIGAMFSREEYTLERLNRKQGNVEELSFGIFISKRF